MVNMYSAITAHSTGDRELFLTGRQNHQGATFRGGPLKPAKGLGERCKLPQRGLGRSRGRNRIWNIFALKSDTQTPG